jgi:hypothetical protein
MPKVLVDKLVRGMKLSRPVTNESGMILLGEGTELTDSLIERLVAMNVESVHIEAASGPAKTKAELFHELDARFKKTEHEPCMGLLKRIIHDQIEKMDIL